MIIQQDESSATYNINQYLPGQIWINQQCYTHSVIVRPYALLSPWAPQSLNDLSDQDFASIYENIPEMVILGTGEKLLIPSAQLLKPLFEKGIGVEFMDSKAAAYTYTILAADQRNVAACILIR